jgi:pimeloyl-ACP methyl ester carboxylesterase
LVAGLVAALLLVAAPFIPAEEAEVTGAVLLGFALGWAMLAVLSVGFSDQPQQWAAAPAGFMGVAGLLLVVFGSAVHGVLSWVWPPGLLALVVWMTIQSRRRLRSRSRRWLLYPVFAALTLASVGGGYETVREEVDANSYPMAGQLIDVGGYRLHLHCTGSAGPTVVLEPGAGGLSSAFGWIAPAVARETRVCVYDRAGRGWSDPAPSPPDGAKTVTDLHTLLRRGQIPGPYVLAGHSFGGLYAMTFAAHYPDEVAGMVLVDSTAPASSATPTDEGGSYDITSRVATLLSTSARLGLWRLYSYSDYGSLPPTSRDEVRASVATAPCVRSTIEEYLQAPSAMDQARSLVDLADKPLVVLTAGSGHDADWMAEQNHMATLSTNSVHRVIHGATHPSLILDEADAAATTQAILDVVSSVRSADPLAR